MDIWKMYWFVRFVDLEIQRSSEFARKSFLISHYSTKSRPFFSLGRFSECEIKELCALAISLDYMEDWQSPDSGPSLRVKLPKGRHLIEGGALLPYGLWIEWLSRFNLLLAFVFGGAVVVLVQVAGNAMAWFNQLLG